MAGAAGKLNGGFRILDTKDDELIRNPGTRVKPTSWHWERFVGLVMAKPRFPGLIHAILAARNAGTPD